MCLAFTAADLSHLQYLVQKAFRSKADHPRRFCCRDLDFDPITLMLKFYTADILKTLSTKIKIMGDSVLK